MKQFIFFLKSCFTLRCLTIHSAPQATLIRKKNTEGTSSSEPTSIFSSVLFVGAKLFVHFSLLSRRILDAIAQNGRSGAAPLCTLNMIHGVNPSSILLLSCSLLLMEEHRKGMEVCMAVVQLLCTGRTNNQSSCKATIQLHHWATQTMPSPRSKNVLASKSIWTKPTKILTKKQSKSKPILI